MICKHCGQNVVKTKFLGAYIWLHQPVGASFMDGTYEFCHLKVATPEKRAKDRS